MFYFFSCSSPQALWMKFPTVKRLLAVLFFSHRLETVRTGPAGVASRIPMFPTSSTDFVGRSYALSSRKLIYPIKQIILESTAQSQTGRVQSCCRHTMETETETELPQTTCGSLAPGGAIN